MDPVQNSTSFYWNLMSPNYPNPDNRVLPIALYLGKYLFVVARRIVHFAFTRNFETDHTLFNKLYHSELTVDEANEVFQALKARVSHGNTPNELEAQMRIVSPQTSNPTQDSFYVMVQILPSDGPNEPSSEEVVHNMILSGKCGTPSLELPKEIDLKNLEERIKSTPIGESPFWYLDLTKKGNVTVQKIERCDASIYSETIIKIDDISYCDFKYLDDHGVYVYVITESEENVILINRWNPFHTIKDKPIKLDKSKNLFSKIKKDENDLPLLSRISDFSSMANGYLYNFTDHSTVHCYQMQIYIDGREVELSFSLFDVDNILVEGSADLNSLRLVLWDKQGKTTHYSLNFNSANNRYHALETKQKTE